MNKIHIYHSLKFRPDFVPDIVVCIVCFDGIDILIKLMIDHIVVLDNQCDEVVIIAPSLWVP